MIRLVSKKFCEHFKVRRFKSTVEDYSDSQYDSIGFHELGSDLPSFMSRILDNKLRWHALSLCYSNDVLLAL